MKMTWFQYGIKFQKNYTCFFNTKNGIMTSVVIFDLTLGHYEILYTKIKYIFNDKNRLNLKLHSSPFSPLNP